MSTLQVFVRRSLLRSFYLKNTGLCRYLETSTSNGFSISCRCFKESIGVNQRRYYKWLALSSVVVGGSLLTCYLKDIRLFPDSSRKGKDPDNHDRNSNSESASVASQAAIPASVSLASDSPSTASAKPVEDNGSSEGVNNGATTSSDSVDIFPASVTYLLIGGGTASFAAFRAIKYRDAKAKILIVTQEPHLPYMRPPLSKELWYSDDTDTPDTLKFKQWNGREKSIFFEEPEFFCDPRDLDSRPNGGVAVLTSKTVKRVDVEQQVVHLDDGSQIAYEKCLIATGGLPHRLSQLRHVEKHTSYFRTIEDYRQLEKITQNVKSVVVIGGGFLGSELACALAHKSSKNKFEVIQTFPEKGILAKVLPEFLSRWTMRKVQEEGVRVISEASVSKADLTKEGRVRLWLQGKGQPLTTDHVVVAVGLEPNVELASSSGLEVDELCGGFHVNAELQARRNVWVAGDAASFYDVVLGRRRVEHHDHAVVSGRLAGQNMTDAAKPYTHQPMFWSDLSADVGIEGIGLVSNELSTISVFAKAGEATVDNSEQHDTPRAKPEKATSSSLVPNVSPRSDFSEEFDKGVVFYCKDGVIVGILLWNIFSKMHLARQVLKERRPESQVEDLSKLFGLYDTSDS